MVDKWVKNALFHYTWNLESGRMFLTGLTTCSIYQTLQSITSINFLFFLILYKLYYLLLGDYLINQDGDDLVVLKQKIVKIASNFGTYSWNLNYFTYILSDKNPPEPASAYLGLFSRFIVIFYHFLFFLSLHVPKLVISGSSIACPIYFTCIYYVFINVF